MFLLEAKRFELVGLVLGLLLEPAGPRGQLVLLLPALAPRVEGLLAHGGQVVDHPPQLIELLADVGQLLRVGRKVVAVAATGLAAGRRRRESTSVTTWLLSPFVLTCV